MPQAPGRGQGDILLVGSVPLESAREVFTTCATALGRHLETIPDGEVGPRKTWIQCQALLVFNGHPSIETITRPNTPDGLARAYEDNWAFRLNPGIEMIDFPDLHYARWAIESYAVFRDLRDRWYSHGRAFSGQPADAPRRLRKLFSRNARSRTGKSRVRSRDAA
jgi:hypothetical protein